MVKLTRGMLPVDPTTRDSPPFHWAHRGNRNVSAFRRNYRQSYILRRSHARYRGTRQGNYYQSFSYRRDVEYRAQCAAEYAAKTAAERKFLPYRTSYDGTILPWPVCGAGGYNYLYHVSEEIMPFYGRDRDIDATLCGACVNKQDSRIVVVDIEHGDGYDDPIYCDDCGALLAGVDESNDESSAYGGGVASQNAQKG